MHSHWHLGASSLQTRAQTTPSRSRFCGSGGPHMVCYYTRERSKQYFTVWVHTESIDVSFQFYVRLACFPLQMEVRAVLMPSFQVFKVAEHHGGRNVTIDWMMSSRTKSSLVYLRYLRRRWR